MRKILLLTLTYFIFFNAFGQIETDLEFEQEIKITKTKKNELNNIKSDGTFVSESDSLALVALYNATDGDNWTYNTNWLTGPVNSWVRVAVEAGEIFSVFLYSNNLIGAIPSEIGNLTNITILDLSFNQISSIPPEIGNLTSITRLDLDQNHISTIPSEIGNLVSLQTLNIRNNLLTGTIPTEIGKLINLLELTMAYNNFTSIPMEIGNLINLQNLSIFNNQLTGVIPNELWDLINLQELRLYGNQLTGLIPKEVGNLVNIEYLSLSNNQFTGIIPKEIGNLTKLRHLYLYDNQLTGAIPEELGNLTNLYKIHLRGNQLTEISNISSMASLSELYILKNKLTFDDFNNSGLNFNTFSKFEYYPQDTLELGSPIINVNEGDQVKINCNELTVDELSSANNEYVIYHGDKLIYGWSGNPEYTIESFTSQDTGKYTFQIKNSDYPELILYSDTLTIEMSISNAIDTEYNNSRYVPWLVYPNPSNGTFSVEFNANTYHVRVYDIIGNIIYSQVSNSPKHDFNLSGIGSGTYFIKIQVNDKVLTKKIQIQ